MWMVQDIGFSIEWQPQVKSTVQWWGWWEGRIYWSGWYVSWKIAKSNPITTTHSYFVSIKKDLWSNDQLRVEELAEYINNGSMRWLVLEPEKTPISAFFEEWLILSVGYFVLFFIGVLIVETISKKVFSIDVWTILPLSPERALYGFILFIGILQFFKWIEKYKVTSKIYEKVVPENKKRREKFMSTLEKFAGQKL